MTAIKSPLIKLLGVDPSIVKTGAVIMNGKDRLTFHKLIVPKGEFRMEQIGEEIRNIILKYQPEVLAIETSYVMLNVKTAMDLANLRGFIQGIFYLTAQEYMSKEDIKIANISPSEAKATLGIKGRLKRAESKLEVRRVLELVDKNFSVLTEDELDAIAISYAGFNKLL